MMRKLNKRQANFIMTELTGIFLALAVAFFFVAMPADIFGRLVSVSGLPAILPAAAPPLSETTRMIVGVLAGSLAGIAVILLFLLIDREPQRPSETVRPFSANSDLVQMDLVPLAEAKPFSRPLAKEEITSATFEIVEDQIEDPSGETDQGPIFLDFQAIRAATRPVANPASPAIDQQPLDLSQWKIAEPQPSAEPQPRPIGAPDRHTQDESIAALMARLESGLEKRMERGATASRAPDINRSGVGVRATLDELRKMAVRR